MNYLLLAGLVLCQLFGLAKANISTSVKKTIVSGTINLDDTYVLYVSDLLDKKEGEEFPLTKGGDFKFEFDLDQPKWVEVSFNPIAKDRQLGATFPMYLQPGDKITLALNYSKEHYLQLTSTALKNENKALIEYAGFSNCTMRDLFMKRGSTEEYVKAIESYMTEADALVSKYKLKQKDIIAYLKLWSLNNYLGVANTNSKVTIPTSILDAIPTVFDTELTLSFYNGAATINNYINGMLTDEYDPIKRIAAKCIKLNEVFKTKSLISAVIEGDLQRYVSSYQVGDMNVFNADVSRMETLINTIGDERLKNTVFQDFKNLHNTSLGSAIPAVKFKDVNGKEVSLDQFKGKYVYIDLWASWCVPCIKEIPYLHELEKQYKDKNIVFVSISLDDNKTAWHKKVDELKLEGNQWELGQSNYDKLMNVIGIPHFILYNPEGKLMQYKAPRPSSKEIKTIFDKI